MEDPSQHLQLSVSNTFLHVKDSRVEALKLGRSSSEPSLPSSSDDNSNSGELWARREHSPGPGGSILVEDGFHVVFPSDPSESVSVDSELSQDDTPGDPAMASSSLSVGSVKHETNTCKPCIFVHTEHGCQSGSSCVFCHHTHKRKSKARPCKSKRDRLRQQVLWQQEQAGLIQREGISGQPSGADQETPANDAEPQRPTKLQL